MQRATFFISSFITKKKELKVQSDKGIYDFVTCVFARKKMRAPSAIKYYCMRICRSDSLLRLRLVFLLALQCAEKGPLAICGVCYCTLKGHGKAMEEDSASLGEQNAVIDSKKVCAAGHRLGNYPNYYKFHSCEDRICMFPSWFLDLAFAKVSLDKGERLYYLDVGCNSGNLTVAMHNYLSAMHPSKVKTLGVDVDVELVKRAQQSFGDDATFTCVDVMKNAASFEDVCAAYLPSGMDKFHVVSLFSITMWVHLNHGDAGLNTFLDKMANMANILIVEPQPWKCYRKAARRLRVLKDSPPSLEQANAAIKERCASNYIKSRLLKIFDRHAQLGSNSWGRTIDVYF